MFGLKFCRICLNDNVRMHQISGSEVQDVYEKLINKKVQEEGRLHCACYICYRQLKNCQHLVIKSQKSEELLRQILPISTEMHWKSISLLDRLTNGLTNSLMVAKLESLKIMDYKNQYESDSNEVMVKDEPDDDSEFQNNDIKLEEEHEQDKVGAIENRKEITSETKTSFVANENKPAHVGCDEIYNNQLLIIDDITCFICNDCGKTYSTKALLIKHMSGHKHANRKQNKAFTKIKKSICHGKDNERGNLKNDRDIDMVENFLKCQYYSKKRHLSLHVKTNTSEKPVKCQYGSFSCSHNSTLKVHIRSHTGEKPFKCKHCSYTCSRSSALNVHIRTHTGEKPYKCQYCSFTCSVSSNLKVHIRSHTGEKPFKCEYCGYTFAQHIHLKSHIRIHTGEKPYKCQYCSFACTHNSTFNVHIKTHRRKS